MIKNWIVRKLCKKLSNHVDEAMCAQFEDMARVLLEHRCHIQQLFELYHEFGHYVQASLYGGVVACLKVDCIVFQFKKDRIIHYCVSCTKSYILVVFPEDDMLLEALRKTVYNGMRFSQEVLLLSTISLRSFLFNLVNAPSWRCYRKGSDQFLYYEFLESHESALMMNANAQTMVVDGSWYKKLGIIEESC